MTLSPYDLATAALISDYLLTGMHHSTVEGREAIARIIEQRETEQWQQLMVELADEQFVEMDHDEAQLERAVELPDPSTFSPTPPSDCLSHLPPNARF